MARNEKKDETANTTVKEPAIDGHLRPVTRINKGELPVVHSKVVSWDEVERREQESKQAAKEQAKRLRSDRRQGKGTGVGVKTLLEVTVQELEAMPRKALLRAARRHGVKVAAEASNRQVRAALRPLLPQGRAMAELERRRQQTRQRTRHKGKLHPKSKFGASKWEDGVELSVYGPGGPTDSDFLRQAAEIVDNGGELTRREREEAIEDKARDLSDLHFTAVLSGKVTPSGEPNPLYGPGRNRQAATGGRREEEGLALAAVGLPADLAENETVGVSSSEPQRAQWAAAADRDFSFLSRQDLNQRLYQAARDGSLEAVEALVSAGASVHSRGKGAGGQWTPLVAAAAKGHPAVVARLCQLGADPARPAAHNCTALHLAVAGRGCAETVQTLVEYGAPVDGRAAHGWTPAHCAVVLRRVRALARLYELGADLSLRTDAGRNASDIAAALNLSHTLRAIALFPHTLNPRQPQRRRASSPQPPNDSDLVSQSDSVQVEAEELVERAPKELLWSDSSADSVIDDLARSFPTGTAASDDDRHDRRDD